MTNTEENFKIRTNLSFASTFSYVDSSKLFDQKLGGSGKHTDLFSRHSMTINAAVRIVTPKGVENCLIYYNWITPI